MGLAEVQQVLARLSIDPALRDRFFAAPDAVGAELGLAAQEALGLARVPRKQVEQFADSLRRKRRDQVRRVIPITAQTLGREFTVLFTRYLDSSPPRGSKADFDDAAGFVAAIRRSGDQLQPEWAVDLARYELSWREAARPGRVPIVRLFRFPVTRLATEQQPGPVAPRPTLAFWWRPTAQGTIRHGVITMPGFEFLHGKFKSLFCRTTCSQLKHGKDAQ
jgi:hypothetical protein